MFFETYPALYRDRYSEVVTTIQNDGKELRMMLRGVEFVSIMFDDWTPVDGVDELSVIQSFPFHRGDLCEFTLEVDMPIPILFQDEPMQGSLHIALSLGSVAANGGLDLEVLILTLQITNACFSSQGKSGFFEDELLDLQRQLPEDMFMHICFSCAFSDYSPCGNGLFGSLACFRGHKQEYLSIKTKRGLIELWDDHTEFVQETYLCREFERRKPRTGYRG